MQWWCRWTEKTTAGQVLSPECGTVLERLASGDDWLWWLLDSSRSTFWHRYKTMDSVQGADEDPQGETGQVRMQWLSVPEHSVLPACWVWLPRANGAPPYLGQQDLSQMLDLLEMPQVACLNIWYWCRGCWLIHILAIGDNLSLWKWSDQTPIIGKWEIGQGIARQWPIRQRAESPVAAELLVCMAALSIDWHCVTMGWWQGGATQSLQMALYGLIKKWWEEVRKPCPLPAGWGLVWWALLGMTRV